MGKMTMQSDKVNELSNFFTQIVLNILNSTFPITKKKHPNQKKRMKMEPETIEVRNKLDILLLLESRDDRFEDEYEEVQKQYGYLLK